MTNVLRKLVTFALVCTIPISLVACTKNKKVDIPKGRYMEDNLKLSDAIAKGGTIFDLIKLKDNTLELIADSSDVAMEIYTSKDNGASWAKKDISDSIIPKDNRISAATIDQNGNIFLAYGRPVTTQPNTFSGQISYAEVDANGNFTPFDVGLPKSGENNSLLSLKAADNGDLFGLDYNGSFYQINMTNHQIKNKYTGFVLYAIVGNTLIAANSTAVKQYDINTGKAQTDIAILKGYIPVSETSRCVLASGINKNELLISSDKGLYRYRLGGSLVERMVDGALSSFGSLDMNCVTALEIADGQFLALFQDQNNQYQLMKYTYSKTVSSVPTKELTVYSLRNNVTIQQEINLFQKGNPDVHVNYETGISENDSETEADALKTLNTEILAGKGPDLIILDDMPLNMYIDKGLLADISDVIGPQKNNLFNNLIEAYQKNNKTYAVPLRFSVPILFSKQEVLSQITDLKSLAEYSKTFRNSNPKDVFINLYVSESLVRELFAVNAQTWINSDGTVDKGKLTDYLTAVKQVYTESIKAIDPKMIEMYKKKMEATKNNPIPTTTFQYFWPYNVNDSIDQLEIGCMSSIYDFVYSTSAMKENSDVSYRLIDDQKKFFEPHALVGLNAKAENEVSAKMFLTFLISEAGQKVNVDGGFPINKTVFNDDKQPRDLTKEMDNLNGLKLTWPSDTQLAAFTSLVEQLKTPIFENNTILSALLSQSDKCMTGKISVEEAADSILDKINLYLSE